MIGSQEAAQQARERKLAELTQIEREHEARRDGRLVGRTWAAFLDEYAEHLLSRAKNERGRGHTMSVLRRFANLAGIERVADVDEGAVDSYISRRLGARGKRGPLSVETIGGELAKVKAALNFARRKKYLRELPDFPCKNELRGFEPATVKGWVRESEFVAMMRTLDEQPWLMTKPQGVDTAAWWRGLLVFLWCTGWRIGQVLKLRWRHVSSSEGLVCAPAELCKAKKPMIANIAPALPYLEPLAGLPDALVFPWHGDQTSLYHHLQTLLRKAGVRESLRFHDFRRGLVTNSYSNVPSCAIRQQGGWKSLHGMEHYLAAPRQQYIPKFVPVIPQ